MGQKMEEDNKTVVLREMVGKNDQKKPPGCKSNRARDSRTRKKKRGPRCASEMHGKGMGKTKTGWHIVG